MAMRRLTLPLVDGVPLQFREVGTPLSVVTEEEVARWVRRLHRNRDAPLRPMFSFVANRSNRPAFGLAHVFADAPVGVFPDVWGAWNNQAPVLPEVEQMDDSILLDIHNLFREQPARVASPPSLQTLAAAAIAPISVTLFGESLDNYIGRVDPEKLQALIRYADGADVVHVMDILKNVVAMCHDFFDVMSSKYGIDTESWPTYDLRRFSDALCEALHGSDDAYDSIFLPRPYAMIGEALDALLSLESDFQYQIETGCNTVLIYVHFEAIACAADGLRAIWPGGSTLLSLVRYDNEFLGEGLNAANPDRLPDLMEVDEPENVSDNDDDLNMDEILAMIAAQVVEEEDAEMLDLENMLDNLIRDANDNDSSDDDEMLEEIAALHQRQNLHM